MRARSAEKTAALSAQTPARKRIQSARTVWRRGTRMAGVSLEIVEAGRGITVLCPLWQEGNKMKKADAQERTGMRRRNEVAMAIAEALFVNEAERLRLYGPAPQHEYRGGWGKSSAAQAIANVLAELRIDCG